ALVRILLPNIRGGIMTAVLFTFIPVFGAYAVPLLVGGRDSYMLGNMIADQLTRARNWPRASAISMVITLVTTAGVMLTMSMRRRDASRLAEARASAAREA
ncbi:MAG: ABC transporter permease, partial [Treponema sp.]|nr:ABC transporter permease [Treponema sp.]